MWKYIIHHKSPELAFMTLPVKVHLFGNQYERSLATMSSSLPTQPKVPRSVQICIFRGWVQINSTQSAKICPNLHWEGGVVQTNSTQSPKSALKGGGGRLWSRPTQPKVPNLHGGGGGGVRGWWSRPTFLKYLSGGTQGILNTNFANWNVVLHHR